MLNDEMLDVNIIWSEIKSGKIPFGAKSVPIHQSNNYRKVFHLKKYFIKVNQMRPPPLPRCAIEVDFNVYIPRQYF